jgi:hypothetical protein
MVAGGHRDAPRPPPVPGAASEKDATIFASTDSCPIYELRSVPRGQRGDAPRGLM